MTSLYTLSEAAKYLRCSERSVERAARRIKKKRGPIRVLRFTEPELLEMVGIKEGR